MQTASLPGFVMIIINRLSFHYDDDVLLPRVPAFREARNSSIPSVRNFLMYSRPRVTRAENKDEDGLSEHVSIPVLRIPELLTDTERHWP